jgi:hypothetical protein
MTTDTMPFLVVVDGKRDAMPWGKYPTQGDATCAAKKLRLLGMAARVVASEETVPANATDGPREAP